MKRMQGFTLIELMIVIAIVAILAAIAFPAYQDYVARSQVSEGLTLASIAQTSVSTYYSEHANFPADNKDAGLAEPASIMGKYVESVTVGPSDGNITILFGHDSSAKINGESLEMQLSNNGGSLQWDCDGGINPKYLPSACR